MFIAVLRHWNSPGELSSEVGLQSTGGDGGADLHRLAGLVGCVSGSRRGQTRRRAGVLPKAADFRAAHVKWRESPQPPRLLRFITAWLASVPPRSRSPSCSACKLVGDHAAQQMAGQMIGGLVAEHRMPSCPQATENEIAHARSRSPVCSLIPVMMITPPTDDIRGAVRRVHLRSPPRPVVGLAGSGMISAIDRSVGSTITTRSGSLTNS